MTSSREVIEKFFKSAMLTGSGGLLWGNVAKSAQSAELVLRPPGALDENLFAKACIKCGQCVEACPYDTLKLATIDDEKGLGTPFFEPRNIPCYLCTNYPCIEVCPSDALNLEQIKTEESKPNIENARMGLAVVHRESCIAFSGIQCDACYRACPLMGKAIVLKKDKNTFTGKHANLTPLINSEYCTGCGICEQVCVTEKPAIFVLPVHIASGEIGDHYIQSWKENDEKRLNNIKTDRDNTDDDLNSAIDYLNNEEELFD